MEILKSKILVGCFFILIFFACLARADEVEDEREFSYEENSQIGPAHWGEIRPEWRMCNYGNMQSPIDLLSERVQVVSNLGSLRREYKPSNATLMNRGHDMMLRWVGDAGQIHINGTLYHLKQCHWHSPSEHTINGKRYDLEAHLVHEAPDGKTAVIGIMYEIGQPDSFLSMMEDKLNALADTRDLEKVMGIVDPNQIRLGSNKYYRYIGSLTVPPCTQNISWTIVKKVRTITKDQVELIRQAVHDDSEANARPIQPINTRTVRMYQPDDEEEEED